MSKRTSIVNISGDYEETLIQLASHLGRSKIRRRIFNVIYGRGTRPRSKIQIMAAAKIDHSGSNAQQVQNELDHLRKHHLIVQSDNDGSVKDGCRYLYGKEEHVRANKEKIIKLADNPEAAKRIATKRTPAIQSVFSLKAVKRHALKKRKHLKVLYLTANPDEQSFLRIDREVKMVQEAVRGSKFRDNISIEYRPAADLAMLINGLNDLRPQIVHFSGHGNETGIATDAGGMTHGTVVLISYELLAKAIAATDSPPAIIVLNSCNSSAAKKILLPGVKIIIGMSKSVSDVAAAVFAQRFYAAIASGQSVKSAFAQGKVGVEAASISDADTPELLLKSDVEPASIILT